MTLTFGKWVIYTCENLAGSILLRRSRWMSTFATLPCSEFRGGGIFLWGQGKQI